MNCNGMVKPQVQLIEVGATWLSTPPNLILNYRVHGRRTRLLHIKMTDMNSLHSLLWSFVFKGVLSSIARSFLVKRTIKKNCWLSRFFKCFIIIQFLEFYNLKNFLVRGKKKKTNHAFHTTKNSWHLKLFQLNWKSELNVASPNLT